MTFTHNGLNFKLVGNILFYVPTFGFTSVISGDIETLEDAYYYAELFDIDQFYQNRSHKVYL